MNINASGGWRQVQARQGLIKAETPDYSSMSNDELERWLNVCNKEGDTDRARSLTAELDHRFNN